MQKNKTPIKKKAQPIVPPIVKKRMGQYNLQLENDQVLGHLEEFFSETQVQKIEMYLGQMIMNFNRLESSLDNCICYIVNDRTDLTGMFFLNDMMYKPKVELFVKLYTADSFYCKRPNVLPKLSELEKALKLCGEKRNAYVHGYRHACTQEKMIKNKTNVSADGIQYTFIKIGVIEVKKVNTLIQKTIELLETFHEKFS